jgi:predicted nuclease of predicted toxin-antitoxin system
MKLLLDESIPRRLTNSFPPGFKVSTVQQNGWSGTENGNLLKLAAEDEFDALITADRGFAYQQNKINLPVTVVILKSARTRLSELVPLVPLVVDLLKQNAKIGVYEINT